VCPTSQTTPPHSELFKNVTKACKSLFGQNALQAFAGIPGKFFPKHAYFVFECGYLLPRKKYGTSQAPHCNLPKGDSPYSYFLAEGGSLMVYSEGIAFLAGVRIHRCIGPIRRMFFESWEKRPRNDNIGSSIFHSYFPEIGIITAQT
jgi:hypothetical protein